jgi:carboxymethylenebutenolidase
VTPRLALAAFVVLAAAPAGAQEWARATLDASPRHSEWVEVPAGDRTVHAFVSYPERKDAAPGVIVIHENRGLTDWVRGFADRLAGEGYVAIAPDLLSGFDAKHRRTSDFADADAARDAVYALDPDRITADLRAVQAYLAGLPAANGRTAVIGFCWGGGEAFRFATNAAGLSAALVFYGMPPKDDAGLAAISAPVFGFYGENDARINATIPETRTRMARAGKRYEPVIYEGAGHAFLRDADDPAGRPESRAAGAKAWARVKAILGGVE